MTFRALRYALFIIALVSSALYLMTQLGYDVLPLDPQTDFPQMASTITSQAQDRVQAAVSILKNARKHDFIKAATAIKDLPMQRFLDVQAAARQLYEDKKQETLDYVQRVKKESHERLANDPDLLALVDRLSSHGGCQRECGEWKAFLGGEESAPKAASEQIDRMHTNEITLEELLDTLTGL